MKRKRTTRRKNYGEGDLFNFHGAFVEKADAVKKEAVIPGAFIKPIWYRTGMRYGVLTKRAANSRRRNIEFGTYEKGIFHPWTRRPKTRKKKAVRRLRKNARNRKRKNTVAWGMGDQEFMKQALKELFPGQKIADVIKDPKQFSKLARRADELKREAKKQNPVIKVPGGWRGRSRTGRLSPVFTDRRDAELFVESVGNPQKRRKVSKHGKMKARRRNYEDATDLYTKFHGRGPKGVKETGLPTADYGDHPELGQLGRLVSLTFGDKEAEKPWTKKLIWGSKEAPDLASEPGGRQLYIIGGGQNLNGSLDVLPIDTEKDMLDLGFAYQLEYFSQKGFDNFQPVTYYHDLGEETGEYPRVVYDRVRKRLHIVGGAYVVKPEGIVN